MLGDASHKFWSMWGRQAFAKRGATDPACWGTGADADTFFSMLGEGSQCDVNWYEGAEGPLGDPTLRPRFTRQAPALLGFDESILGRCNEIIGVDEPVRWGHNFNRAQNNEVAHSCEEANQNILRLLSSRQPWNMCQNLRWMMCAVRGLLPGQQDVYRISFATAPKSLSLAQVNARVSGRYFPVGDVFYLELCLLSQLCSNREELFEVEAAAPFECDVDMARYRELEALLRSSRS